MDEWDRVLEELEEILNYKFKNIKYLKEALIHESYYTSHCESEYEYMINYEKLEVLGDAVLDVIVNSTLAKFAKERNVSPFEIHHSKARLVNNELLCKIATFYGIHRFILRVINIVGLSLSQFQIERILFGIIRVQIDIKRNKSKTKRHKNRGESEFW